MFIVLFNQVGEFSGVRVSISDITDIIFVVGVSERPWRSWYIRQGKVLFVFFFSSFSGSLLLNLELGKRCLLSAMQCRNVIWITVGSNYAIAIATPSDWFKPTPVFQPMGSKAKTKRTLL